MNLRTRAPARSAAIVCALLFASSVARGDEPSLMPPRLTQFGAAAAPEPVPPPPVVEAPVATGSVSGVVLAHGGDAPIAGAMVVVTSDSGATFQATTGTRGRLKHGALGSQARPCCA